jgi:hypothetical protein
MKQIEYPASHEWHVSINKHAEVTPRKEMRFMYEAKSMAFEVPRMAMLFAMEREKKMPDTHRQCSHSTPETIADNHLTCALGKRCSECPHLAALDDTDRSRHEDIDMMKAWTCAAHIVSEGGDNMNEGYLLTTSDRMYWDRLHTSLMQGTDLE